MRLDGYIRVSRIGDREGEGYISPAVQRDAISAYAGELGGEIIHWGDDQDFSGGTLDRPAFQASLERLREGVTDGLVVMRIDRFARSVADGAAVVREIVDRGQVFAACHERIDPRTPEGTFMLNSFLNNAELFLNQAKAGWKVAKARAIARGVHIGPTPIGYEREKSMPLTVDSVRGPAITELFARCATRQHGDSALARWMSERCPPGGRRAWNTSEVRRWLRSRVYLGEVRYGDLVNTEAHPPLTDLETWERCQREKRLQRKAHSPFLLSGLVKCAACHYAMGGQTHGGHDGNKPVYRCSGRNCDAPAVILCSRLDSYVSEVVTREVGARTLRGTRTVADLTEAERSRDAARAEYDDLATDIEARRLLGPEKWRESLATWGAEVERWEARVREVREGLDLAELTANASDLDWHGLRDLLRGTLEAVLVRRGRLPVEERAVIVPRGHDLPAMIGMAGVQPGDD